MPGSGEVGARVSVPARIIGRFEPVSAADWRRMDNNTKDGFGKARFLELPNAVSASSERVAEWLRRLGLSVGGRNWVTVKISSDLRPRYVNLAYSARCVDAFLEQPDGMLEGVELKVTGDDGISGLSISTERLLAAGALRVFSVNGVRGLIGEIDPEVLLSVPRRLDGVPVGEARIAWLEGDLATAPKPERKRTRVGRDDDVAPPLPSVASGTGDALWRRLLQGFYYASRPNNTVHQIKSHSELTIGEVCVGKTITRLNFKDEVRGQPSDIAIQLVGRSKTWRGGGTIVTEANLSDCRRLIAHVVEVAHRAL